MGIERVNALLDINHFDRCAAFLWGKKVKGAPLICKKDIMRCVFDSCCGRYSENECELMAGGDFHVSQLKSEFADAARTCLLARGNKIAVDIEHYKEWRKIALINGQDIFVSALFGDRFGYKWNYSLPIESTRLDKALKGGYAENHCHFYLAGPTFDVNWLYLHNGKKYDRPIRVLSEKRNKDLFEKYYSEELFYLFRNLSLFVIYLRRFLYSSCVGLSSAKALIELPLFTLADLKKKECFSFLNELKREISDHYSFAILNPNADYADRRGLLDADSGERQILCSCFEQFDRFDSVHQCAFYLYLIVKRFITGFFIQNNLYYGFNNFQRFERFSELFIPADPRSKDFLNRSIFNALLENERLRKLEIRAAPKQTHEQTQSRLSSIERAYERIPFRKPPIGLTMHFIKKSRPFDLREKHTEPRCFKEIEAYDMQVAFIKAIMRRSDGGLPLVGIDAANEEIRCRPEIFAPHYRTLRNFEFIKHGSGFRPRIKFTFHVGEDFTTLADGLRAIGEAIEYLELNDGDRLGHASALGTDIEKYFLLKGNRVLQTKQDYLDDLCFLYQNCRLEEDFYADVRSIREKIETLLLDIYGTNNVSAYIRSMRLRCDYPTVFFRMATGATRRDKVLECCSRGHRFYMRQDGNKDYLDAWNDPESIMLAHLYHYSSRARYRADEVIEFAADFSYKKCIAQAQKNLAQLIKEKGIGIETNPTSNYLIGPFDDFEDIPTFALMGIGPGKEFCKGILLTIGTDDPGLFGTNLRNEYGSILLALLKTHSPDGCDMVSVIKKLADTSLDLSFIK